MEVGNGMSKIMTADERNHIAQLAMIAMLIRSDVSPDWVAKKAYKVADAMLAASKEDEPVPPSVSKEV